jgi:hypothetical protein
MNVDMTGMSEQGIRYAQSLRDHLFKGITEGDENYTYEDFVQGVIGLQDFMLRDKKTYAENLAAAKPILDASLNDAAFYDFNKRLETAAKTMPQSDVQRYATDFDFKLENPYPGTFFNPADMMLFPSDPNMAARTMTPINGMNILGAPLPDANSFQYELQDIPTGNVLAYTKEKNEQNLLSLLGSVDNEADARNIIQNHFSSFILGRGPGRKALSESLSGLKACRPPCKSRRSHMQAPLLTTQMWCTRSLRTTTCACLRTSRERLPFSRLIKARLQTRSTTSKPTSLLFLKPLAPVY